MTAPEGLGALQIGRAFGVFEFSHEPRELWVSLAPPRRDDAVGVFAGRLDHIGVPHDA